MCYSGTEALGSDGFELPTICLDTYIDSQDQIIYILHLPSFQTHMCMLYINVQCTGDQNSCIYIEANGITDND